MSKARVLLLGYFLFSLLNLSAMRLAIHESLSSFMVSRGMTAIVLSVLMFRISQKRFLFPLLKHTQQRILFGGFGMTLQIMGASQLPISTYALLNRATPVWFSMLTQRKSDGFSCALIAVVGVTPFILQAVSPALLIGVSSMLFGTLLIAYSQKSQVEGAALESRWLMPFAPALGVLIIGLIIGALSRGPELGLSGLGVLSGVVMTLAYWIVQPILAGVARGGTLMVLCDLGASVVLGLREALELRSPVSLLSIGITILVFAMFTVRRRQAEFVVKGLVPMKLADDVRRSF